METDDPGGGGSSLPVLGRVDGSGVTASRRRRRRKGKLSRDAIMVAVKSIVVDADVDRPGRGQPRRGMEHRLGCDPGRRRRAADRQRRPV